MHSHDQLARQELQRLNAAFPLKRPAMLLWKPFRTTAGRAHYLTFQIDLSTLVLKTPEQVLSTLRHEYAHLLAYSRCGAKGRGHGKPWRQAMLDLGEQPEVKHAYQCQRNRPRQQVIYACLRCKAEIIRFRKLPAKKRYVHAQCGGEIRFLRIEALTTVNPGT